MKKVLINTKQLKESVKIAKNTKSSVDEKSKHSVVFEDDDELYEADDNDNDNDTDDDKMSEEELKIESLKIATNIAKLMKDVTPNDIVTIASNVASFIRNYEIGSEDVFNQPEKTEEPEASETPEETEEIV